MLDADRALHAFVREDTGVPFEPLVRFAEPLFEAYGVEPGRALALKTSREPDEAPEELLLVLETARLLWAYFALEGDTVLDALPQIEGALLQGEVGERERVALHLLLARLEDGWHQLESERLPTRSGQPAPTFETLLARYGTLFPPEPELPHAEADADLLAEFARPLLDDPRLLEDPDAFDRQMELAHALFEYAGLPEAERGATLERIARRFPESAARLPALAQDMIARYHALFPDRPTA